MPNRRLYSVTKSATAQCVVIKHGDITAGHIGHMHAVAIFHQTNQGAAHTDHIIVRVRTETEHRFPGVATGRMIFNRILHPAEHAMRNLLRRTMMTQQLMKITWTKIIVIHLQTRLARLFAQPQHGAFNQAFRP